MIKIFKKKTDAQKAVEKIVKIKKLDGIVEALMAEGWQEPEGEYRKTSIVSIVRSKSVAMVIRKCRKIQYHIEWFYLDETPDIEWLLVECDDWTSGTMHYDLKIYCRELYKESDKTAST